MTSITWKGWSARYTPEEKKLMPKTLREAEFIHELKARFGGVLSEGDGRSQLPNEAGSQPAEVETLPCPSSESTLFPIPERARLELDLMGVGSPVVEAEQLCRTGLQRLLRDGDRWFVSIRNRTYASTVEIPADRVQAWREAMAA